ncbi:hypothetical protein BDZ97DRAFT_1914673 [Flammula alnicola]|nr:hypothetical protein BDZ97DRAFT_1914673 [Flammula alnicola]
MGNMLSPTSGYPVLPFRCLCAEVVIVALWASYMRCSSLLPFNTFGQPHRSSIISQECGYHNSMVDFTYRRRRCDTCQDTVYKDDDGPQAVVNAILGNDPDAPHDIWRLIPFAIPNCLIMYTIQNTHARCPRDYQAFVTTTVAETREYVKHSISMRKFAKDGPMVSTSISGRLPANDPTFYDICRKRLVKLGHNPQDAKVASEDMDLWLRQMWDLTTTRKLNMFWKYLPKLEVMVADAKRDRLDRELQHRIRDRRDIVTAFYTKIVKAHFQPEVWEYLPVPHAIYDIDLFSDYIHNEQEVVGELPVKAARAAIRRLTDKWVSDKKRYLVEIMVMAGAASPEASPLAENCALDLAGAVFECPRGIGELELEYYCPTLVGWEDAGLHLYCYNDITEPLRITDHQARIQFSEVGYKSVLALLALLELDPRTTLARDLDTLNARFICTNCPLEYKNGMQGRHAMDWRECVSHAIRMRRRLTYDLHKLPAFAILSESVAVPIRAHESIHFNPTDLSWSCKHCAEHFESPVLRQTAVAHVKESHSIFKPTENIDFFYRRNKDSPTRKLYFVGQDADSNHLCMKCYHPKSLRLRIKDRLLWHLRDKHDCPNPVEGVDWVKVEIFEKTTEEPNNPLQDS